jgi:hypothetical protein
VATANITEKPLGRRIDPPDDSRRVEDIAGTPTLFRASSTSPPTAKPPADRVMPEEGLALAEDEGAATYRERG